MLSGQSLIYPGICSICTWKECVFYCFWMKCSIKFIWSNEPYKTICPHFYMDNLSSDVSRMLKFPTIIMLLSISPFMSANICFVYLDVLLLDVHYLWLLYPNSWIDPFIIMQCPSLSLFTVFVLKSILSDASVAAAVFFLFLFAWNLFFHPLIFSRCVSSDLKWISYRQPLCLQPLCAFSLEHLVHLYLKESLISMSYCHCVNYWGILL